MIFCAHKGDKVAVDAILHLGKAPGANVQMLSHNSPPPVGSVFLYTDRKAKFTNNTNNLRIVREPVKNKGSENGQVRRVRDTEGFVEPACARTASVVIALRPNPVRSIESQKCALECLFEQFTKKPFDPVMREKTQIVRKARRERQKERAAERKNLRTR